MRTSENFMTIRAFCPSSGVVSVKSRCVDLLAHNPEAMPAGIPPGA
jgi:hypothetical protein